MDEKGELIIGLDESEPRNRELAARLSCMPGPYLCLSVQDNGCGIAPENLEKIFDPFFTTKDLHEGTGMGLSTVQGIVEQHHGLITVESCVGQGTTFMLYFPAVNQRQTEDVKGKESELLRGTERILYVEDDEMLASINGQMLSDMGYQVSVINDSVEALKLFSDDVDNFDLVITDQTMPELTGIELIQKIKRLRPRIPAILCTGYSSKVNEEEALQKGADVFLMKPVDFTKKLEVLRNLLEKCPSE